jgi:membrane associated rhomboid family serine protease
MLIPYHVDVPMFRIPWMNWMLILTTVVLFPVCGYFILPELTPFGEGLVLGGPSAAGIVGHMFVHIGILHLLGNMIFLWTFGNAVCAKVGNLFFPLIYLSLGAAAGGISYAIEPRPSAGASGAVSVVVGMFSAWYVLNQISCWLWFIRPLAEIRMPSWLMVLIWLGFNIWGASQSHGHVNFACHLAGFGLGFGLAITLQLVGWVQVEDGERSLLQIMRGQDRGPTRQSLRTPAG